MKTLLRPALITMGILMIPLVGQFPWTASDFFIMGALIFGTGLVYELVVKRIQSSTNKIHFTVLLILAFVLVWAELAVGIFGTPFAGS